MPFTTTLALIMGISNKNRSLFLKRKALRGLLLTKLTSLYIDVNFSRH